MPRSTTASSESRRRAVIDSAVHTFAVGGYLGTPTTAVAEHAGISPAYVFKLFPTKTSLFVAAVDRCFDLILAALADGAAASPSSEPEDLLSAMGGAYARLISDRDLLLLQVQALSASEVPQIREAMITGTGRIAEFARSTSGGSDAQIQEFMARGQLCHMITMLGIADLTQPWARAVSGGIRHYPPQQTADADDREGGAHS